MLGHLLKPECEELIRQKDWAALRIAVSELDPADIAEVLDDLPPEDSGLIFRVLPRALASRAFEYLPLDQQTEIVQTLKSDTLASILDGMSPDDRTRLFEELPAEVTRRAIEQLSPEDLRIARQLLGYPEGSAGRVMTPRYLKISPGITARDALDVIRKNRNNTETLNVVFLVDAAGRLMEEITLAALVLAEPEQKVEDIQTRPLVSIEAKADRDTIVSAFEKYDRTALPVTDSDGMMLGLITVDDVLDVAEEQATEAIHNLGGTEALDTPYMDTSLFEMVRKRGGWLSILLVGEMFTTTAMSHFDEELQRAAVLVLFLPLIISSGGNSGSQATSIIIRALALKEISLRSWAVVLSRELRSGILLGSILALIGMSRILLWEVLHHYGLISVSYGEHYMLVALTVGASLIGVVTFGTIAGSMLPIILRWIGFDPAKASAPFVATLVDVTGIVIYFTVAASILRTTLLAP